MTEFSQTIKQTYILLNGQSKRVRCVGPMGYVLRYRKRFRQYQRATYIIMTASEYVAKKYPLDALVGRGMPLTFDDYAEAYYPDVVQDGSKSQTLRTWRERALNAPANKALKNFGYWVWHVVEPKSNLMYYIAVREVLNNSYSGQSVAYVSRKRETIFDRLDSIHAPKAARKIFLDWLKWAEAIDYNVCRSLLMVKLDKVPEPWDLGELLDYYCEYVGNEKIKTSNRLGPAGVEWLRHTNVKLDQVHRGGAYLAKVFKRETGIRAVNKIHALKMLANFWADVKLSYRRGWVVDDLYQLGYIDPLQLKDLRKVS